MATIDVVFAGTWITNPVTLASVQAFTTDSKEQNTLDGSVRKYAGGRSRVITSAADTRTSTMTFRAVSAADLETLRSWRGRVLLLRDPQGWRRWGTFLGVDVTRMYQVPPIYDVSLTFTDLTYVEGV
jgi:hypothetical protein